MGGENSAEQSKNKNRPLQVSLPVMKRRNHDPTDEAHAYASKYIGFWITEVSLIQNSGRVITAFREKRSLLDMIERQREEVRCSEPRRTSHVSML